MRNGKLPSVLHCWNSIVVVEQFGNCVTIRALSVSAICVHSFIIDPTRKRARILMTLVVYDRHFVVVVQTSYLFLQSQIGAKLTWCTEKVNLVLCRTFVVKLGVKSNVFEILRIFAQEEFYRLVKYFYRLDNLLSKLIHTK